MRKPGFTISEWNGIEVIETTCPKKSCPRPYRIDANHHQYAEIKRALERGDRSGLACYHRPSA